MLKYSKFFRILLVLLITSFSCSTPKKLSIIEERNAKITEFKEYTVFETDYLSVRLPKLWKTYLEPNAKEQIRHSPIDRKGNIDQTQYMWIVWMNSPDPDSTIAKKVLDEERVFYKLGYIVSQNFVKNITGSFGKGIQTELKFSSTSNSKDFKMNHFYLPQDNGYLEIRMVYEENNQVFNEMKKVLESITIK